MIFDLRYFIPLLLIDRVESFRDSYSLSKVLAWKFGIITVLDIINKLEQEDLLKKDTEHGICKYEVTSKGREFIEANINQGKALMLEKYGEEEVFISHLF